MHWKSLQLFFVSENGILSPSIMFKAVRFKQKLMNPRSGKIAFLNCREELEGRRQSSLQGADCKHPFFFACLCFSPHNYEQTLDIAANVRMQDFCKARSILLSAFFFFPA